MDNNNSEVTSSPEVPILAFFSVIGGVGKTTIANVVGDLAAVAPKGPNVLIIDMDVHSMGTTVHRTRGHFTCRTIHQHMIQKDSIRPEDVEAEDVTNTISRPAVIQDNQPGGLVGEPGNWGKGRVYVIPCGTMEDYYAFHEQAAVSNAQVKQNLDSVIKFAVKKYNISLVLIDCSAIVDGFNAAAARVATYVLIIRDPNPECQLFLEVVRPRLQAFYPDFDGGKLYMVMNKAGSTVTGADRYFAIIPFTPALVDTTVFVDATEVQLMLFHADILEMMKRAFKEKYPDLIPEDRVVVPRPWLELVKRAPHLRKSLRLRLPWLLIGAGLAAIAAWAGVRYGLDVDASALGVLLVAGIISIVGGGWFWNHYKDHRKHIDGLIGEREKWLLREIRHLTGQEVLSGLRKWLRVQV
jgi:cellulose biosynthesis protein BcsQ